MERGSLIRFVFFAAAVYLFVRFGLPAIKGEEEASPVQPIAKIVDNTAPKERARETTCKLEGPRFKAELSTRGATLKHMWMMDDKYHRAAKAMKSDTPAIDLVTTNNPSRMPLRTNLRGQSGKTNQVAYDDLDWKIASQTKKSCVFSYEDDNVLLTKEIHTTERPFELAMSLAVKNKAKDAQRHRLTVEQTDWRTKEETEGSWGRQSEFLTRTELSTSEGTERYDPSDFDADDFEAEDGFTAEQWKRERGEARWAAVTSSYFAKAVFHLEGPAKPAAEGVIEAWWDGAKYKNQLKDPNFGHVYRARLSYPEHELASGAAVTYKLLTYNGPKERQALAVFGGAEDGRGATDLLDLGVFGVIGKVLVRYLYWLYGIVGVWGWAICLMTITVKVLLFPLSLAQIKSSVGMRKLKPEMDAINEKYKDDMQMRGLALQELYKKNNVGNPMLGCIPVALQMPIWFALYTSLQTAVELYHEPFGPFIPDLSSPGLYYVIPALLGISSFIQQRVMPMQGDEMQQKMLRWVMPIMFTGMMLFLPAGLGIYFLTNTWLGIIQQVGVEKYYKSQSADSGPKKTEGEESAEATT